MEDFSAEDVAMEHTFDQELADGSNATYTPGSADYIQPFDMSTGLDEMGLPSFFNNNDHVFFDQTLDILDSFTSPPQQSIDSEEQSSFGQYTNMMASHTAPSHQSNDSVEQSLVGQGPNTPSASPLPSLQAIQDHLSKQERASQMPPSQEVNKNVEHTSLDGNTSGPVSQTPPPTSDDPSPLTLEPVTLEKPTRLPCLENSLKPLEDSPKPKKSSLKPSKSATQKKPRVTKLKKVTIRSPEHEKNPERQRENGQRSREKQFQREQAILEKERLVLEANEKQRNTVGEHSEQSLTVASPSAPNGLWLTNEPHPDAQMTRIANLSPGQICNPNMPSSPQDFQPYMGPTHASMNGTGVDNGTPAFLTEAQTGHNSTPAPAQQPANSVPENYPIWAGQLGIDYFPQIPGLRTRNPLLGIPRPRNNVDFAISNIRQNHGFFTRKSELQQYPSNMQFQQTPHFEPQQQSQPSYSHQNMSPFYPMQNENLVPLGPQSQSHQHMPSFQFMQNGNFVSTGPQSQQLSPPSQTISFQTTLNDNLASQQFPVQFPSHSFPDWRGEQPSPFPSNIDPALENLDRPQQNLPIRMGPLPTGPGVEFTFSHLM